MFRFTRDVWDVYCVLNSHVELPQFSLHSRPCILACHCEIWGPRAFWVKIVDLVGHWHLKSPRSVRMPSDLSFFKEFERLYIGCTVVHTLYTRCALYTHSSVVFDFDRLQIQLLRSCKMTRRPRSQKKRAEKCRKHNFGWKCSSPLTPHDHQKSKLSFYELLRAWPLKIGCRICNIQKIDWSQSMWLSCFLSM